MKKLPRYLYILLGASLAVGLIAVIAATLRSRGDAGRDEQPMLEASAAEPRGVANEENDISQTASRSAGDGGFKVVVYYPNWQGNQLNKLRFDIITHVNYAFAIPTTDGGLMELYNSGLARDIIKKAHDNNAKALIAIGGWSHNDIPLEETFRLATDTPEKVRRLGDAILAMCDEYGFDGVDMDWEYPRRDDGSEAQYEDLMLYLSNELHAKGELLTAAVVSGIEPDGTVFYDAAAINDKVLSTVDWVNVMAYDGGDGERHSGYDFAVNSGNYWKGRELDASQVVLGVPFYARPRWVPYEEILAADDTANNSDIIWHNGEEIHYNGQETIIAKTKYAADNFGGVMAWEITQDTSDPDKSLLTAISKALGQ